MKTTRRLMPRVGMSCACILVAAAMLLAACEETRERDDDDDDNNNNNNNTTVVGGSGGMGGVLAQGGSGGSGGIPPTVCDYPPGPYGNDVNATISKYQTYSGVVPGGQQIENFRLSDLYDCDGTHGVDAILVVTTQYG